MSLVKNPALLPFIFILLFIPAIASAGPKEKVQVTDSKKTTCAYSKKKNTWRRSQRRKRNKQSKRSLSASGFKADAKAACSSLISPKAVDGLGSIPKLSGIVKGIKSFFNRAVSGTPPTLSEISQLSSVKELFWIEGLIDRLNNNTPTADDCNHFFGGQNDGDSAGLSGCFMVQETARAIESMLSASASLCYFKAIPTVTPGQGITIVSGEDKLPQGDFTKIFNPSNLVVEMRISGFPGEEEENEDEEETQQGEERIFFRAFNKNKLKKNQYAYEVFFCRGDENALEGYERTTISKAGKIDTFANGSSSIDSYENIISGYLGKDTEGTNRITFNALLPRTFTIQQIETDGTFQQRAFLSIDDENVIRTKSYNVENSDENQTEVRRSYSINQYIGTTAANTQFLQGAYKDDKPDQPGEGFSTSVEFRDSRYLTAPNNEFVTELSQVDLETDTFYQSPAINFDANQFDCSTQADIVLALDFSSTALQAILADCESDDIRNMDFCFEDEDIRQAEENYNQTCDNN